MSKLKYKIVCDEDLEYDIDSIPISEESVIEGCIKFYDDKNHCFIHRTSVKSRLLAEIEKYFAERCTNFPQAFYKEDISENVLKTIDIKNIKKIIISI